MSKNKKRVIFALGQVLIIGLITLVMTLIANAEDVKPGDSNAPQSIGNVTTLPSAGAPIATGATGAQGTVCDECAKKNAAAAKLNQNTTADGSNAGAVTTPDGSAIAH